MGGCNLASLQLETFHELVHVSSDEDVTVDENHTLSDHVRLGKVNKLFGRLPRIRAVPKHCGGQSDS